MKLQDALTSMALMGAEWVMWLLLALSVVAVAVIVERAIFFVTSRDDARLGRQLRELLSSGDLEEAQRHLEATSGFGARVAAAALRTRSLDNPAGRGAEECVAAERSRCRLAMEKRLAFLGTLGNNAPFVGLLGTVIGIIAAFSELAANSGQVSAGLMAEIGEALVVTGLGLLVALPAVASFNVFQQLITGRIERGDALAQQVIAYMKASDGPGGTR